MKEKILIIGASSSLSVSISKSLHENDFELIGTYNKNFPKNPEDYKKLIKVDLLRDNLKLNKIIRIVSQIVFTIGSSEYLDEKKAREVNFETLKNLLRYLKTKKKKCRIIFCSSSAVYGNNNQKIITEKSNKKPTSIYGRFKLLSEELIKKSKQPFVIVRTPIIFGENFTQKFKRFIEAVKEDKVKMFGEGKNNFSFINEEDISKAFLLILKNKNIRNEDFNFSTGFLSQEEYLKKVFELYHKEPPSQISLSKALDIAEEQLILYKKFKIKPRLFKEDVIGLARSRRFNCIKSLKILGWSPQQNIDSALKDTFVKKNILSRWDGIKILKHLFSKRTLPVKIYRDPNEFKLNDFKKRKEEIWSVTIRTEKGEVVNTGHLFSKDPENIKEFMRKKENSEKLYIVRLSPPKREIAYYGSYLFDNLNFDKKVVITISKKSKKEVMKKNKLGESFNILPRDLNPDYTITYENKKFVGKFPKRYSEILRKDIIKLTNFLKKTQREDLTTPALFIIDQDKKLKYISLGL